MSQETAVGEAHPGGPPADATEPVRGSRGIPPDAAGSGLHRRARKARQRPIRSTLTVLLVIPLVSLIALWAYAASSTVGGALGKRNSDSANKIIGAPTQGMFQQLIQERQDTFVWQSARGLMPRTAMDAQRRQTDAAVTAFRAAVRQATGVQTRVAQSGEAVVLTSLGQLSRIRAGVDAGTLKPLTAYQEYSDIYDSGIPLGHGTLADPNMGVKLYEQGEAAADEGEALELIGREAGLVGGALVTGGRMSATEHQLFVEYVGEQRLLERIGESPAYWQQNQDPYLAVFASPQYQAFRAMEDRIAATSPGTRLAVTPDAFQSTVLSVLTPLNRAETLTRLDTTRGAAHEGDVILLRLFVVGGAGLLAVIVSALLLLGFGNRIARELTGLKKAVRTLADERLPDLVTRLRQGDDVDVATEAPPLALATRTREVTETADAFSAVQRTAVEAAVGQAQLRKGVSSVFRSLARRSQSLLQRQLRMLDEMERGTHDPEALAQLFRLDHLTTRMRRQAEGLIILSGAAPGRGWRQPVPIVEVLRGAIGEIEDYVRVELVTESRDFIAGTAVADVTHLLAELVENAVLYSPPNTRVQVKAGRVANGYVVEVEDRGLGIPPATLDALNERLSKPPEFDLADSDQLGLFVVSRLAARHGIKVSLRGSPYGGSSAIVLLPPRLVAAEDQAASLDNQKSSALASAIPPAPAGLTPAPAAAPASAGAPAPAASAAASPAPAPPAPGQSGVAGPYMGLPRRPRQASLAPQLRDAPAAASRGGRREERSPEEMRALLSSMQQGWRTGRAAADEGDEDTPGTREGRPGS